MLLECERIVEIAILGDREEVSTTIAPRNLGPRAGACRARRTLPLKTEAFHPVSAPSPQPHCGEGGGGGGGGGKEPGGCAASAPGGGPN
jgi:hypothetical protein